MKYIKFMLYSASETFTEFCDLFLILVYTESTPNDKKALSRLYMNMKDF